MISRLALTPWFLRALGLLAMASLAWGGYHALTKSADLMRRVEEVALVVKGVDPYRDPDMTYPPTAPMVFVPLIAPFAAVPVVLRGLWMLGNLAALLGTCGGMVHRWGRDWSPALRWGFLGVVAASKPVRLAIGMGQFALIPMALVLLAFSEWGRKRPAVAGVLLGSALVKPTMVVPFLVVFALRGRWRTLAVAAIGQAVALLAVSAWLDVGPGMLIREWIVLAKGQQVAGLINVPSVLARLGWDVSGLAGTIALVVLALGTIVLIAGREGTDLALLSFAGLLAAISTYHRPYDLVLMVPTLALLIERARASEDSGKRSVFRIATMMLAALLVAPAHPAVVAESHYEAIFIPAAYGLLGLVTVQLVRESRRNARGTNRDDSNRNLLATEVRRRSVHDTSPLHAKSPEPSGEGSGPGLPVAARATDQYGSRLPGRRSGGWFDQLFKASS